MAEAKQAGKSSDLAATCNIVMAVVGLGILKLPGEVSCVGVGGFAILIVLGAFAQALLTHVFYRAMLLTPDRRGQYDSYTAVGEAAYGRAGKIAAGISVHVSLVGICACILILWRDTLQRMVPIVQNESTSKALWALIGVAVAQPFVWLRSMSEIGVFSTIGVVAVLGLAALAVCGGLSKLANGEGLDTSEIYLFNGDHLGWAGALTSVIFSFGSVPVIPSIYKDMKNPQNFTKVLIAAYAIIFILSATVALIGYLGYGSSLIGGDVMKALVPENKSLDAIGYLASIAALLVVLSHIVVLFSPVADASENTGRALFGNSELVRKICRTLPSAAILGLGLVVPSLNLMVGLVGSVTVIMMCLVLPPIFYWKLLLLRHDTKSRVGLWITSGIIIAGSLYTMIFGLQGVVQSMIK